MIRNRWLRRIVKETERGTARLEEREGWKREEERKSRGISRFSFSSPYRRSATVSTQIPVYGVLGGKKDKKGDRRRRRRGTGEVEEEDGAVM